MNRRRDSSRGQFWLGGGLIVLLLVAVAAIVVIQQRRVSNRPANVGNQSTPPLDETSNWPKYYARSFGLTAPLPKGMTLCSDGQTFSMKNDECQATTAPTFLFRRSDSWESISLVAAFNDAFAQELREAGIVSAEGRTATLNGDSTNIIYMQLSDTLFGAMVVEMASDPAKARKVAITVRRDIPPQIDGQAVEAETILSKFLRLISFVPGKATDQIPSTNAS
ncbi:MAG: hypothetical protein HY420_03470 [Candidatus Kerfeldbacteria bacterium]|nr:hypothetical protein [Candidatus Kerfeldbacteria bacterium]